jgi:hypothetical protein
LWLYFLTVFSSELCTAVETMYSLSYLYQALGDNSFADRCELAAFNALPVAVTPDWWARQYMTQPNQPYAKQLSKTPFSNTNVFGQTYSLEGNYPCCTVNHPQGYPKFLAASFVKVGGNGIAHALLSPAKVNTRLASGEVTVQCQTNYPFDNTLDYKIAAPRAFDFYVRVPTWAIISTSRIAMSGQTIGVQPDAHTGLHRISIPAGKTSLSYTLSASVRIEHRANASVAIHHGALLYGLEIGSTNSSQTPLDFRSTKPMPHGYAPPQVRDWTMTNTTPWAIAIDPSTLSYHHSGEKELKNPIWALGAPPNWITVKACDIAWPLYLGSVPDRVPLPDQRKCLGAVKEVKLVPFGSAKLHMSELPTMDLSAMWNRPGADQPMQYDIS